MEISIMATAKINGSNYTTPPNTKSSGAKNVGGASTRIVTNTLLDGVAVTRGVGDKYGSVVVNNNTADKAISGNDFAKNTVKPIGTRLTSSMIGPASSLRRGIHSLVKVTNRLDTTGIRANKYNRVTNTWDVGYPQTSVDYLKADTATVVSAAQSAGADYNGDGAVNGSDTTALTNSRIYTNTGSAGAYPVCFKLGNKVPFSKYTKVF